MAAKAEQLSGESKTERVSRWVRNISLLAGAVELVAATYLPFAAAWKSLAAINGLQALGAEGVRQWAKRARQRKMGSVAVAGA